MCKNTSLDASDSSKATTFTVIHPFSPFTGRTFTLTKTLTRCGITFIHFETEDGMVQSIRADWTDHDAIYGKGPDTRSKCLAYYEDLVDLNTAVKKMLNR